MDNLDIFQQLQRESAVSEDTGIQQIRKQLNEIVNIFKSQPDYRDLVKVFAEEVRNLEVETLTECDSFMLQPETPVDILPEELRHDSLGFCRGDYFVFEGRYVYPVKDVHGDVMGFCGYDKFEEPKYLDSKNYGYKAKSYSCWGMEKLPEYYRSTEPVYIVEGIVCALYLRQSNLQSLALLGSNASPYMVEVIKRFGDRAIIIHDADDAGSKFRKVIRRKIPNILCIQSTIAKDVDDSRMVDPTFVDELRKLKNRFYRSTLFK